MEEIISKKPLISIITVVCNGAPTIEITIRSVLQQSYPQKEYIIIDGGSTDGTQDVIRKYEDQLSYWVSEPDKGIFDAMNKGIQLAKGELIGIINADDWYEDNALEIIAEAYLKSTRNLILHGLLRNYLDNKFYSIKGNSTGTLKYDMIQHPTCFIPNTIYQRLGCYDTRYAYTADFDLVLRLVDKGIEFLFLERVIANFRIGGASLKKEAQKERILLLKKYRLISKREATLRLILLHLTHFMKSVSGIQKN